MKAIYKNKVYSVEEDYGDGLILQGTFRVPFSSPELIVDPTDGDLENVEDVSDEITLETLQADNNHNNQKLEKVVRRLVKELHWAEGFISGFEDEATQPNVTDQLVSIRAALKEARKAIGK